MAESAQWDVSIIGLALVVFTLANLLTKPYQHKSDTLLCVWLLLLSMPLLHTVLAGVGLEFRVFNQLTNPSLNLLHGPILLVYVRMLIGENYTVKKLEWLHLVPFVVMYGYFLLHTTAEKMIPMPNRAEQAVLAIEGAGGYLPPLMYYFGLVNGVVFVAYAAVTIYFLLRHQKRIAQFFSQKDTQISLNWIYALPCVFALAVVVNVFNEKVLSVQYQVHGLTLHMLSFLSIITLLCFFGARQKPVFHGVKKSVLEKGVSPLEQEPDQVLRQEGEAKETLSSDAVAEIVRKVNEYMITEKPYTDPDFSVYILADSLDLPRRLLSRALNEGISKNFYQLVNEYRIEEVKRLLVSDEGKHATILDLAFQSGFKSKSSFNSLFKQYCQLTPSQYRKSLSS